MSRFGGLSEERPSVFKTPSKLGTHLWTQCSGDERQSRPSQPVNRIPDPWCGTSCAADGASNMMGKKNGCLKLMKDANPEMILVIHRQNLVAKIISPVLNEILHTVIKCVKPPSG
ncbi:SCAN domain-containing protein 3 [Trichonephila clavipes]|nr:SCAN domain-containing protein 3 [Trichonephila clavipes]